MFKDSLLKNPKFSEGTFLLYPSTMYSGSLSMAVKKRDDSGTFYLKKYSMNHDSTAGTFSFAVSKPIMAGSMKSLLETYLTEFGLKENYIDLAGSGLTY